MEDARAGVPVDDTFSPHKTYQNGLDKPILEYGRDCRGVFSAFPFHAGQSLLKSGVGKRDQGSVSSSNIVVPLQAPPNHAFVLS